MEKLIKTKWVDISYIDNLEVKFGKTGEDCDILVNGKSILDKYQVFGITWKIGGADWNNGSGVIRMKIIDNGVKVSEKKSKEPKQKILVNTHYRKIVSDNTSVNTKVYFKSSDGEVNITDGYFTIKVYAGDASTITEIEATSC